MSLTANTTFSRYINALSEFLLIVLVCLLIHPFSATGQTEEPTNHPRVVFSEEQGRVDDAYRDALTQALMRLMNPGPFHNAEVEERLFDSRLATLRSMPHYHQVTFEHIESISAEHARVFRARVEMTGQNEGRAVGIANLLFRLRPNVPAPDPNSSVDDDLDPTRHQIADMATFEVSSLGAESISGISIIPHELDVFEIVEDSASTIVHILNDSSRSPHQLYPLGETGIGDTPVYYQDEQVPLRVAVAVEHVLASVRVPEIMYHVPRSLRGAFGALSEQGGNPRLEAVTFLTTIDPESEADDRRNRPNRLERPLGFEVENALFAFVHGTYEVGGRELTISERQAFIRLLLKRGAKKLVAQLWVLLHAVGSDNVPAGWSPYAQGLLQGIDLPSESGETERQDMIDDIQSAFADVSGSDVDRAREYLNLNIEAMLGEESSQILRWATRLPIDIARSTPRMIRRAMFSHVSADLIPVCVRYLRSQAVMSAEQIIMSPTFISGEDQSTGHLISVDFEELVRFLTLRTRFIFDGRQPWNLTAAMTGQHHLLFAPIDITVRPDAANVIGRVVDQADGSVVAAFASGALIASEGDHSTQVRLFLLPEDDLHPSTGSPQRHVGAFTAVRDTHAVVDVPLAVFRRAWQAATRLFRHESPRMSEMLPTPEELRAARGRVDRYAMLNALGYQHGGEQLNREIEMGSVLYLGHRATVPTVAATARHLLRAIAFPERYAQGNDNLARLLGLSRLTSASSNDTAEQLRRQAYSGAFLDFFRSLLAVYTTFGLREHLIPLMSEMELTPEQMYHFLALAPVSDEEVASYVGEELTQANNHMSQVTRSEYVNALRTHLAQNYDIDITVGGELTGEIDLERALQTVVAGIVRANGREATVPIMVIADSVLAHELQLVLPMNIADHFDRITTILTRHTHALEVASSPRTLLGDILDDLTDPSPEVRFIATERAIRVLETVNLNEPEYKQLSEDSLFVERYLMLIRFGLSGRLGDVERFRSIAKRFIASEALQGQRLTFSGATPTATAHALAIAQTLRESTVRPVEEAHIERLLDLHAQLEQSEEQTEALKETLDRIRRVIATASTQNISERGGIQARLIGIAEADAAVTSGDLFSNVYNGARGKREVTRRVSLVEAQRLITEVSTSVPTRSGYELRDRLLPGVMR